MTRFLLAVCALSVATGLTLDAQNGSPATVSGARPYVPVTDEMLWKPDPANWLSWRRTLDGWGYSPLDQIDRNNVSRLKMVWTRGLGTGTVEATPLVYDGVMYVPGPGRRHRGDRREDRRSGLGAPPQAAGGRQRRHQPQHRDLGQHAHRRQRRQSDLRGGRPHRQHGVGNGGDGGEEARALERRPDHRQRQGDHRPPVPARRRQRRLHHHRARRADRQGSVADANDSAAWSSRDTRPGATCR